MTLKNCSFNWFVVVLPDGQDRGGKWVFRGRAETEKKALKEAKSYLRLDEIRVWQGQGQE